MPKATRAETAKEPPLLEATPWKTAGEVEVEIGDTEETLFEMLVRDRYAVWIRNYLVLNPPELLGPVVFEALPPEPDPLPFPLEPLEPFPLPVPLEPFEPFPLPVEPLDPFPLPLEPPEPFPLPVEPVLFEALEPLPSLLGVATAAAPEDVWETVVVEYTTIGLPEDC